LTQSARGTACASPAPGAMCPDVARGHVCRLTPDPDGAGPDESIPGMAPQLLL